MARRSVGLMTLELAPPLPGIQNPSMTDVSCKYKQLSHGVASSSFFPNIVSSSVFKKAELRQTPSPSTSGRYRDEDERLYNIDDIRASNKNVFEFP